MDPNDHQPKSYLVFQSKQAFMSTYNRPALPNQQLMINNPFLSWPPPAGSSYTFNRRQLQLLQQQHQQMQSQQSFRRRISRLPTIWDCAPVPPFQYGMFLPQPRPQYAMIPPCGAAKRIRLEEAAEQQPSNGSVSNNFPVSAGSTPVKEAKLEPTRSPSQSLGIEGKDNGQNIFFAHDEARKASPGKRKRREEEKKMDMDMSMSKDVDTELRL